MVEEQSSKAACPPTNGIRNSPARQGTKRRRITANATD